MPRFVPSVLIADCWGSVGDLTFYHVDGRCYYKKKAQGRFAGTDGQLTQLDVHRRAMAAWREVPHEIQKIWHEYGKGALSTGQGSMGRLWNSYSKSAFICARMSFIWRMVPSIAAMMAAESCVGIGKWLEQWRHIQWEIDKPVFLFHVIGVQDVWRRKILAELLNAFFDGGERVVCTALHLDG